MSNMHKKAVLTVVLVLIAVQLVWAVAVNVQPAKASVKVDTLLVPLYFPTISDAIGNATAGQTILVSAGTYYENPVINIPLTVKSEVPNGAVVIGAGNVSSGGKGVFTVAADGITLEGFTIESLNYTTASYYATGVLLQGNNCTISDNTILGGTWSGVFSSTSSNCTIAGNTILGAGHIGLRISGGSHNIFSNNLVSGALQSGVAINGYSDMILGNNFTDNKLHGLGLGAPYSVVYDNNLSGNKGDGLYLGSSNCIIKSNTIAKNKIGVCLENSFAAPDNDTFYGNNFLNNTIQVAFDSSGFMESWDNGAQGNYWSDYTGTSSANSGVGDSPYPIYGNNTDHYPLIYPALAGTQPSLPVAPQVITGTIAAWDFDEMNSDGVVADLADGNDMVLAGNQSMLAAGVEGTGVQFNGTSYGFVAPSSTLTITGEVTIDAWVSIQQYKQVEYNTIFVDSVRTTTTYPFRLWGLAINGVASTNGSEPAVGAMRGFFTDDKGVFSEIDTTTAIPLNAWTHVVFVRSLTDGMHIYLNGTEQNVTVFAGSQNPTGVAAQGNECYIGHDSFSTIDDISISNVAIMPNSPQSTPTPSPFPTAAPTHPLWAEWWFWTAVAAVFAVFFAALFLLKRAASTKTL